MSDFDYLKYLRENKLKEEDGDAGLSLAQVEKIAQDVANEFSKTDDLDLNYIITPDSLKLNSKGGQFALDTKSGKDTPGDDWKDENGFGIDNYLGRFAGGNFSISAEDDGFVVKNAASKNAVVGYVTPEGELDFVKDIEKHYDKIKESRDLNDPVLMKMRALKSKPQASNPIATSRVSDKLDALKKYRAQVMLDMEKEAEMEGGPIADKYGAELNKIDAAIAQLMKSALQEIVKETQDSEVLSMVDMVVDALGAEKFVDELILAMDTDEAKANLEHIIRMYDLGPDMDDREDMPGFEGTFDALDSLKIREENSNKMTKKEIKEMIRQNILNELSQGIKEDSEVDFGDSDVGLSKLYSDFYEEMEPSMNEDARTDAEEEGYKDGMKDEKEDLEGAGDEEVKDTEKVDIKVKEPIANEPTLTDDEKAIQGHLDQALKLAQGLDQANSEKLVQQIGNTVTFFTRDFVVKEENNAEKKAHYKGAVKDDDDHIKALEKDKEADEKELKKLDESMFPLFKKIIK